MPLLTELENLFYSGCHKDAAPTALPVATAFFCFGGGEQGGGKFFVEREKEFDALAVGLEFFRAIAEVNGAIQFRVRLGERGRHGERVVKVGERGGGELLPRVQHGLRLGFHGGALLGRRAFRPREIVEIYSKQLIRFFAF